MFIQKLMQGVNIAALKQICSGSNIRWPSTVDPYSEYEFGIMLLTNHQKALLILISCNLAAYF